MEDTVPNPSLMAERSAAREQPWNSDHIRATHDDETWVAAPELDRAADLARGNHELLDTRQVQIHGRPLSELREWARAEVCRAAREYTGAWRRVERDCVSDRLLFVGGHQPTLFHAGVWAKNFVVAELARREGFVGLNLVVDTDMQASAAIRMPRGTRDRPVVESVPFDVLPAPQPWEEAGVADASVFESFPRRVAAGMKDWGIRPLVQEIWPDALSLAGDGARLADCVTAARNLCEQRWGSGNLELPISRICELEPFQVFAADILERLPEFHRVYNEVLREYRQVNRVRSRTHPVPDLRSQDGWLETPFRIWGAGDRQRKRVFAKRTGGRLQLSDGSATFAEYPLSRGVQGSGAVDELQRLQERGLRFRTRALTTTLFARLCFADLFVHGIGGAKYDQITDRIISRFFGLTAPGFLTLSATTLLPVPSHPVTPADERRIREQIRELDYHSERHISMPGGSPADLLAEEKVKLIEAGRRVRREPAFPDRSGTTVVRGRGNGYDRFRRLKEINRQLAELTSNNRSKLMEDLTRTREQLSANAILEDREYSFCLFPAEKLRRFMEHVCRFPQR